MEINKRACKVCKELKNRILDGSFDSKNKRYVDENGWLWNGSKCPQCQLTSVREKMKLKREKKSV